MITKFYKSQKKKEQHRTTDILMKKTSKCIHIVMETESQDFCSCKKLTFQLGLTLVSRTIQINMIHELSSAVTQTMCSK
jgi:hypothetical protein